MHDTEIWQEYIPTGVPLMNGGSKAVNGWHPDDRFYGSSAVWLYRKGDQGLEILFQKRSHKMPPTENPGKYDFSAGGHINYEESPIEAAVRECQEEIGATLQPDRLVLEMCLNTGYGFLYVYSYDWTGQPDSFHFDDQEVDEVKWVPLDDLGEFREKFVKDPIKKVDIYFDVLKRRA